MLGYRDDGVVLRTQKLGEADRIITLLTRQNGRVRAVAKGVRRTKSRFGGRLEPFTHVDVMIHPGRSLDVITQAEVIRPYGAPLAGDYPRYTAGTAMLETAERFTPVEKEPALRQFLLLIGGLRALGETGEDAKEPRLVLDAYLLRSLAVAGYAPALEECARCGAPGTPAPIRSAATATAPSEATAPEPSPAPEATTPEPSTSANEGSGPQPPQDEFSEAHTSPRGRRLVAFAVAAGGMVCASCRPPGAASPSAQTVALMLALLRGDWEHAMRTERRHRVECSGLVAAYLQWHLEHSIRSLRHVERA
ncbi:MAG TPA: DNA repair protein RecO [Trebonia sp.]|nr:DNA repair protein RecO [Trebonia sp.]